MLSDIFIMISLNSIKHKGYINPEYALAYAIIKRFNLTANDKEKIEKLDMDDNIRKIIYEALGIK
jgi:hypothetical protein